MRNYNTVNKHDLLKNMESMFGETVEDLTASGGGSGFIKLNVASSTLKNINFVCVDVYGFIKNSIFINFKTASPSNFSGVDFENSVFVNSTLNGSFYSCNFTNCKFINCNLKAGTSHAKFNNALIDNCDIIYCERHHFKPAIILNPRYHRCIFHKNCKECQELQV